MTFAQRTCGVLGDCVCAMMYAPRKIAGRVGDTPRLVNVQHAPYNKPNSRITTTPAILLHARRYPAPDPDPRVGKARETTRTNHNTDQRQESMIDLLQIEEFLDEATCERMLAELRALAGQEATVLDSATGGRVAPSVRRTTRLQVSPAVREQIVQRLGGVKARLEQHFNVVLGDCEEPQFLRYLTGDYFVPHQDGNTPMVYDDSRFRRISAVIFLSRRTDEPEPCTYGGGSLVMHGHFSAPNLRIPVHPAPGTLVAFRPETTHEVTPVTHGERYTIACWFRAPV